jgi:folate-dependent phosphoribosylglycinamide formyltransferase PurN
VRLIYQLGWFSTGRDKAARDLLETVYNSIKRGEIRAEIAFVFCSRDPGESEESDLFLRLVEDYQIPSIYFSYQRFKAGRTSATSNHVETLPNWRLDYDREVMGRLQDFHPDLCVLAGYMLIVGKEMCRRYNMINLHPAAPGGPTGTWQEVIWQLIETNTEQTGVMMHLVTPELDKGPPVAYCTFPIRGEPFDRYWRELERPTNSSGRHDGRNSLFRLIRQHGLAREFPLIVATIKSFSQGRIKITEEKSVVDADERLITGYNLTDEINEQVKGVVS